MRRPTASRSSTRCEGWNGVLVGAVYGEGEAAGTVLLAGKDSNQYVDLPNHLLDGLKDVTLEAWVIWAGGGAWQRIFDFGEDETGVDGSRNGVPRSYIFLSFNPRPRFALRTAARADLGDLDDGGQCVPHWRI